MSRQKATMSNIEGRRLANDVHMDRSEWILAARRTLKELCREIERLDRKSVV